MIIHLRQKLILRWLYWHQYLLEDEHCESVEVLFPGAANVLTSKCLSHDNLKTFLVLWLWPGHHSESCWITLSIISSQWVKTYLSDYKIWKIRRHMQQMINVHVSESRTMCSKSACSTCCDWSAETKNSRELRSPGDLIGYKYTVRPPATKMELILGFLLPHSKSSHPSDSSSA